MALGDTSIAIGGGQKAFYRAFTGNGQYMPDSATLGIRAITDGAAGLSALNTLLDAVDQNVTTGGGGFIVPPGEAFQVRFIGWTDATCVMQEYNVFTDAWETIFTWPSSGDTPLVAQRFISKSFFPLRIGASAIGADNATLKAVVQFGQSDRFGGH